MIHVKNLEFAYPGSSGDTIRNISFEIARGEIFGFLGPSGAGKSTTQKILTKLLRNFRGEVQLAGKDLKHWSSEFYNHIGVGFELPNHYSKLTALENLRFFGSFYSGSLIPPMDLLRMVGLEKDAKKKTGEYSKGMKVRLNFIRAIMHDPEILFLDEPTSGLDPANARNLKDIILDQKARGKTIFLTTHNMHDAEELCDRVSFISDGNLVVTDSPRRLKLLNGKRIVKVEYGSEKIQSVEYSLDKLGENKDFLELLRRENIVAIHSKEAGLDDIFIKVTGRNLN
ncbi:MAG: ABC transporter ATP-binding protein [Bacteroidales bacterium]|nr:ABC transporter ATP-binding protein [Bacteroidales bacterium]